MTTWFKVAFLGLGLGFSLACSGPSHPQIGHIQASAKYVSMAEQAIEIGDYPRASVQYKNALKHARIRDDQGLVAELLHNYATSLQRASLCNEALPAFREAIDLSQKENRLDTLLMSQLGKGTCEYSLGMTDEAQVTLSNVLRQAKHHGQPSVAAHAAAGLGALATISGHQKQANRLYADAADFAAASSDSAAIGLVRFNQARQLARLGDHARAYPLFDEAAKAYQRAGDSAGMASALSQSAISADVLGRAPIECAQRHQRAGHAAASTGQIRLAMEEFTRAASQFEKAKRPSLAQACRQQAAMLRASMDRH